MMNGMLNETNLKEKSFCYSFVKHRKRMQKNYQKELGSIASICDTKWELWNSKQNLIIVSRYNTKVSN